MSGTPPSPIIAPTSYPGAARIREEEGPRTHVEADFSWFEDPVLIWRAVGVLGGAVFAEGILLWAILTYVPGLPGTAFALPFVFLAVFSGVPLLVLGDTYDWLAVVGATIVAVVFGLILPIGGTSPSEVTAMGLLVAGAILFVLGVAEAVRALRALDKEEAIGASQAAAP